MCKVRLWNIVYYSKTEEINGYSGSNLSLTGGSGFLLGKNGKNGSTGKSATAANVTIVYEWLVL